MARIIDTTYGHQDQISKLMFLRESGRFPQSMAFVGPSGVGKKRIALAIAQSLVCESSSLACGVCGPCLRIEKKQSESLYIVEPDPEYAKPLIRVDDIRNVFEKISLATTSARMVIIDSAHLMNEQAANALLKNLEEPGEKTYFVLIANEIQQLLPTIRSRVQSMSFFSLSPQNLKQIKPGLPEWAYRSARGQVDQLEILTSKQGATERQEALDLLEQFCFDDEFLLRTEWRKSLNEDRNWALFNMKCWLQMVRDALVLKTATNNFVINTDQIDFLKKLTEFSFNKLSRFAGYIVESTRDIKRNQEAALVVDTLRIKYARVD